MSAVFLLRPLLRFLTSRTGILVLICFALFAWHKIDKTSAVRRAVAGYVADVELSAKNAELAELKRRSAVFVSANKNLLSQVAAANADAEAANQELEHYVSTVDDDCAVDGALLERLRNR
ncbi:hypothetical protein [Roseibium aggregatum]|uniref:Uncharacterized protein n=1 Tax=Roseibium aggregatum TaxID=187304 RepID=A0A926NX81_9HYPH|nr:hypothetical protein [Roseibium aggregatum]MBD1544888.1 hypothetical protein [Roseibium aggregatum]